MHPIDYRPMLGALLGGPERGGLERHRGSMTWNIILRLVSLSSSL